MALRSFQSKSDPADRILTAPSDSFESSDARSGSAFREKSWYIHASFLVIGFIGAAIVQYMTALQRITSNLIITDFSLKLESSVAFGEREVSLMVLEKWSSHYYASAVIIALLAIIAISSRSSMLQTVVISFQILFYGISMYADAFWLLSQLSLFSALAVQSHLILKCLKADLLSIGLLAMLLLMPRISSAWYYATPAVPYDRALGMGIAGTMAAGLLHLVHRYHLLVDAERRIASSLKQSVLQLTSANVSFQDYAASAEARSSREERNRITREVHDTTGYTLTNLVMMLEAAKHLVDTDSNQLKHLLQTAREQAQNALAEIRRTLRLLRAENDTEEDRIQVLYNIFRTYQLATNVQVQVEYRNIASAPRHMINAPVYRLIQESLTNAFRHGNATRVNVLFWYDKGLSIIINDNGIGTDVIEEGIGLKGMREQVKALGGTITVQSVRGSGFDLQIRLPERNV